MKKTIVLLSVLAAGVVNVANAANDTIRYGDSCYYLFNEIPYPFVSDEQPFWDSTGTNYTIEACNLLPYQGGPGIYDGAKLYVGKSPDTVYGVAATMRVHPDDDTVTSVYTAYLFKYVNAQMILIDSSAAYSKKNVFVYTATGRHDGLTYETCVSSLEFYFSQPYVVVDSFAVGIKKKTPPSSPVAHYDLARIGVRVTGPADFDYFGEKLYYSPSNTFIAQGWCGYFFPIVQPERIVCEGAVAEVAESGGDYAVLEWEMGGDSCQLSVAPYDIPVDSGLVVDLTANSYTATGLDTGVYYAARLRTQCHHSCHIHADTVVWSGWGAPTLFYLGSEEPDTSGIGIRRVEEAVEFSVTPNPARGTTTVRCAAGLQTVELLGVKGDVLLRREAAGSEACVLDLTGLAKGIYIVRITTSRGTAAQKLAVE